MPSASTRAELYYAARVGGAPSGVAFARGRLVLLGEHLDHQGGPVLAVALPEGVHVAYGIRPDRRVMLHALNARASDVFELERLVRSGRHWADLARGVFARLQEGGWRLPGLNLVAYGDLPPHQGLASSAAYVTALVLAVLRATDRPEDPAVVARDVAAIERDWGGVACGPLDPYVGMVGTPDLVVHLDTRQLVHETLALPKGVVLEPESTGIRRRLDRTPYNERRSELAEALRHVRRLRPDVRALVDLAPEAFAEIEPALPDPLRRRARHVVTEVARVRRAVEALAAGDAPMVGRLMREGHESLSKDFESSLPAIDLRVAELMEEPEVFGARLQGAGWGGSIAVLSEAL